MKKYLLSFLVLITLLVFPAVVVSAGVSENPRITDAANLFTETEVNDITEKLDDISNKYDLDVIVITTKDSLGDGSTADFDASLERFHDKDKYDYNAIFCGINMDPSNREVIIQAYGDCQKYIPDYDSKNIADSMVDDLAAANYASAISTFTNSVNLELEVLIDKHDPQLPKIEKGNYFIDDANIFTDHDDEEYLSKLKSLNEKYDIDLYALTLDAYDGNDLCDYIDSIAADNGLTENVGILAILLGDSEREVVLCGYGEDNKRHHLINRVCQSITDNLADDLSNGFYNNAMDKFLEEGEAAISQKQLPISPEVIVIELLMSMFFAGIYVVILFFSSSTHSKATRHTYQKPGSAQVLARIDNYTHTTVTKKKIESSSSSGGSSSHGHSSIGGGGHSHGGSSHSSGRSKF